MDMEDSRSRLRDRPRANYKEPSESDIPLLKPKKPKSSKSDVFPIEVVDEDATRVKVHYLGYSHSHDEWKPKQDIINLDGDDDLVGADEEPGGLVERFSLHQDLSSKIKAALNSGRKDSPVVKIDMPFDQVEFNGGLCVCGKKKRFLRGVQHYTISRYQDLNKLLGTNWHYRGLNKNGDFCFVILDTIEFYLYRRRPLKEYIPTELGIDIRHRELGYMLVFTFVKGNGTSDRFGTDKNIFF